jgi:hypothetical protein
LVCDISSHLDVYLLVYRDVISRRHVEKTRVLQRRCGQTVHLRDLM